MFFHLARNMVNGKLDVIVVGRIDSTAGELFNFLLYLFLPCFFNSSALGDYKVGWSFQRFFIFTRIWGRFPF